MEYESPLSPYEAIKKAENFFANEVINSKVKEKSLSKKDQQMLEMGVTGGNWEIFWMKIFASRNNLEGSRIYTKSRFGLMQLSFASIITVLSGPFLYLVLWNEVYWALVFPSFFFLLGVLSFVMPFYRIISTSKNLKQILTNEREIILKKTNLPQ
ncbi:MAG TPA: hypothetical protein VMX55_11525 [candidate division Zixibacteria bacterium]|nr:hypothetical protein [candidate division Zixibacteria bacterium]